MEEDITLMFIIICGSAVIPFLARKFRLPSAVLEILFGIFLFNTFVINRPGWFALLKEIGLIYLMFIAGMELDLRRLMRQGRFLWYCLIPLLSLALFPFIVARMGYPFFTGVAVSVFSAGLSIPVLKEMGLLKTDLGGDIVGIALAGELISILALTGIYIYHTYGLTLTAGWAGAKLVFLMALGALFLRVLYVLAWWNPEKVRRVMESDDPVEEGIRAVISIAFAGAIVAHGSGVEPILGSFMAGFILSHVFKSKGRFEEKINAVGFGFFTPFFFIGVGAEFDIRLLKSLHALSFSTFLALMVLASNCLPLIFSRFMGLKKMELLGMVLLLSTPFTMMVVASTLGAQIGYITEETKESLILAAMISGILYSFLFRLMGRRLAAFPTTLSPPPS